MSHFASVHCSRVALRLAFVGAAASLLAGCAGSERLTDPFSNPFGTQGTDPAPTASINPSAPVTPVQARPLAAPVHIQTAPAQQVGAAAQPARVVSLPRTSGEPGWSAAGGTPVVVRPGDSADVLANRYGVPKDALLKANGFASGSQIQPGARVVIPVYNAAAATRAGAAAAVAVAPTAPAPAPAVVRTADAHAEKIRLLKGATGAGGKATTEAAKEIARAEPPKAAAPKELRTATLPPTFTKPAAAAKPAEKVAQLEAPVKKTAVATEAVAAQPVRTAMAMKPEAVKAEAAKPAPEAAKAEEEDAGGGGSNPEFRWPARGRIIQGFKPGGNDGINIAVPEGTSVKAAEAGVVAYAGSELKGYGNLILIRHPNGFVSAYANNGDIEVKRGETVKRGQTIAKSGQSGNVASPQLHFELRKGATPVDPTNYLAGL